MYQNWRAGLLQMSEPSNCTRLQSAGHGPWAPAADPGTGQGHIEMFPEGIVNGQDSRQALMAQIVAEQVGRISAAFADEGIPVEISAVDGAAFMYAADEILVREEEI